MIIRTLKVFSGDFPGSPMVETALSVQGSKVRPLVGKLRSHMTWAWPKKRKCFLIFELSY